MLEDAFGSVTNVVDEVALGHVALDFPRVRLVVEH